MVEKFVANRVRGGVEERGEEDAGQAVGAHVGEEEGEGGVGDGVDGGGGEGAVGGEMWRDWL